MTMPNFLIIGAAKCGTDALYQYLGQHPEVYMSPVKETNFFVVEGQEEIPYQGPGDREALEEWQCWFSSREDYEALFSGVTTETAVGEASPWYIYDECAPRRIRDYIPGAKLIAILRNPVDRAYSAFTMLIRDGRETTNDFSSALAAEDRRVAENWEPLWHLRRQGYYYAQLKRYFDLFPREQIKVVLYDDFSKNPGAVMSDLFTFLEVRSNFVPDMSSRPNVSLIPKNRRLHNLLSAENPVKSILKPLLPEAFRQSAKARLVARNLERPKPITPEIRKQLAEQFRPDIFELQDLIARDLSGWLTG